MVVLRGQQPGSTEEGVVLVGHRYGGAHATVL
jgi:hypothetical protein